MVVIAGLFEPANHDVPVRSCRSQLWQILPLFSFLLISFFLNSLLPLLHWPYTAPIETFGGNVMNKETQLAVGIVGGVIFLAAGGFWLFSGSSDEVVQAPEAPAYDEPAVPAYQEYLGDEGKNVVGFR